MLARQLTIALILLLPLSGCLQHMKSKSASQPNPSIANPLTADCAEMTGTIEYPDVDRGPCESNVISQAPRRLADGVPENYWDLTLEEAIAMSLRQSDVLKDLGGRILQSPSSVQSIYDPSITMSHPRLGEEGALAAFDARWNQLFTYGDGTQSYNNTTLGGGGTTVKSDFFRTQGTLSKTSATGAQFSLGGLLEYRNSDAPFNLFPSAYSGTWEANIRQPLMQGSGTLFNRIAGPDANVDLSISRGVILARINGDISVADFERGVRDFLNEVEQAYWQLYLAYRTLETNMRARDMARDTWESAKARFDAEMHGGRADVEAQAREQLYLFEQQVVTAINGPPEGTGQGVYQAERQLRRMLGLPMNDGQLIRPADEPTDARVVFDWDSCLADALTRRVELRQQMWRVKQRELELLAARNFLLPRLDALGTYRVTGIGDDLFGGSGPFSNLGREMGSFDNDEVELGIQLAMPLGYRREMAAVRHSELQLCRERAILHDQEHQISHDVGEAIASLDTTFENNRLTFNRMVAADQVVAARTAIFEAGMASTEDLLEAQRRLADAQLNYYRARVAHINAITRIHYEKGTLLPYNGVNLTEGDWDRQACEQSARESLRYRWHELNDFRTMCPRVSRGDYQQAIEQPSSEPSPMTSELPVELPMELPAANAAGLQRIPSVNQDDSLFPTVPIDVGDTGEWSTQPLTSPNS